MDWRPKKFRLKRHSRERLSDERCGVHFGVIVLCKFEILPLKMPIFIAGGVYSILLFRYMSLVECTLTYKSVKLQVL